MEELWQGIFYGAFTAIILYVVFDQLLSIITGTKSTINFRFSRKNSTGKINYVSKLDIKKGIETEPLKRQACYISKNQYKKLRKISDEKEVSIAHLIRIALDKTY